MPLSEIDVRYFDSPYYLIPDDQVGLDAFAVFRDAMASTKMVGVGRVVLQKRERPILLEPVADGWLLAYWHAAGASASAAALSGAEKRLIPETSNA